MSKRKPRGKCQIVFALLEKGVQIDVIAKRVGWNIQQVRVMRSRWKNPERYRQHWINYSRRNGRKAREDFLAEERARVEARVAEVKPLLTQDLSYSAIGERLGVTRNTVAGLVHRNRSVITHGEAA